MRKLQIGVMGSAADLNYKEEVEKIAERIGELVAEKGCILFFGAEKDYYSLSTAAAKGAKRKNGLVAGVTYGKSKKIVSTSADIIIPTGLERGGGREFVLSLCTDVIIAVGGGSGTLMEIAVAYQADIPVVVIEGTGGWSDKLAGTFLDGRQRQKSFSVKTPEEAVELAIGLAEKYCKKYG